MIASTPAAALLVPHPDDPDRFACTSHGGHPAAPPWLGLSAERAPTPAAAARVAGRTLFGVPVPLAGRLTLVEHRHSQHGALGTAVYAGRCAADGRAPPRWCDRRELLAGPMGGALGEAFAAWEARARAEASHACATPLVRVGDALTLRHARVAEALGPSTVQALWLGDPEGRPVWSVCPECLAGPEGVSIVTESGVRHVRPGRWHGAVARVAPEGAWEPADGRRVAPRPSRIISLRLTLAIAAV